MRKKKNHSAVEAWELFDINAPDEGETEKQSVSAAKRTGRLSSAVLSSRETKKLTKPADRKTAKKTDATTQPVSKIAEEPARSEEITKTVKPKKKKKSIVKKFKRRLKKRIRVLKQWAYDKLVPRRFKLTEEELEREKKRKKRRKAEEKKFRSQRRALSKRRKAARKALRKQGKIKSKRSSQPKQKRGFFRSVWALFDWFYLKTTDPEEKENHIQPRIFGRTLTYTGFMILMVLLIVVVFLVLNNRTVGVEREEIVVTGLNEDFKGFNILIVSDLNAKNFGENQSTIQRLLASEKFSLVLMLGDMVGPSGNTEPFYQLIDMFVDARKTVYFIAGDSDPSPLLDTPRDAGNDLTWRQMVLSDWVLGAIEHKAIYLDCPMSITRGSSKMWLVPDTYLNLNVSDALNEYKDAYAQEQDAYLIGIDVARETLPITYYRRNLLDKTRDNIINMVSSNDVIVMLSHEAPSNSQLNVAQGAKSETDKKNYFPAPDVVFAGHYCGGEWKLPLLGTFYVDSSVLPRYGWFPDEDYVQGQRSLGSTVIYTTQGLGNNAETILHGRLNNPPRMTIVTLTGELPSSFLE